MKKLRLGLPILAFVLAVATSAFTAPQSTASSVDDPQFYWFDFSQLSPYQGLNTEAAEKSETGCTGTLSECERGYTQEQLVNGDPAQGVKEDEIDNPAIVIRHVN